jgi:hypothetical protein
MKYQWMQNSLLEEKFAKFMETRNLQNRDEDSIKIVVSLLKYLEINETKWNSLSSEMRRSLVILLLKIVRHHLTPVERKVILPR